MPSIFFGGVLCDQKYKGPISPLSLINFSAVIEDGYGLPNKFSFPASSVTGISPLFGFPVNLAVKSRGISRSYGCGALMLYPFPASISFPPKSSRTQELVGAFQ
ncbi:hypothetical protein D3C85_1402180 [compost metagenome]